MKQQSLSAFFAPTQAAKKKGAAAGDDANAGAKENVQAPSKDEQRSPAAATNAVAPPPAKRLKRLKRTTSEAAAPAAPAAGDEPQDDMAEGGAAPPERAAPAPAATAPRSPPPASPPPQPPTAAAAAAAAPPPMSPAEAGAAFSKMFSGARKRQVAGAAAPSGGKAPRGSGATKKAAAAAPRAAAAVAPAAAPAAAAALGEHERLDAVRRAAAAEGSSAAAAAAAAAGSSSPAAAAAGQPRAASPAGSRGGEEAAGVEESIEEADSQAGGGEADGEQRALLDEGGGGAAGASSKPKAKGKAGGGATRGKKAQPTGKVEGVGAGALEAAKAYATMKVEEVSAGWEPGKPAPFSSLAEVFEAVAGTTKRLEIIQMLVRLFCALLASAPSDLLPAVYLCVSRVAPPHEGLELGIGEATLIKALAQATGRKEAVIRKDMEAAGDLGTVAAAARATQRTMFPTPPLTVAGVVRTFRDIAGATGASAMERKRALINKLLVASKGVESGYIIRLLQGKMRIGLQEQSVLVALAHAVQLHKGGTLDGGPRLADKLEQAAVIVKQAYSECPSYDALVPALLEAPVAELPTRVHFTPGIPVRPMLAKATTGVSEVLDKFSDQEFTCEYKYDGERTQIHVLEGGAVRVYSRNAEDNTQRYPDIVGRVPGWLAPGTRSIVVDGEAVAWDPAQAKILPFQVLSTRGRKDVSLSSIKVQVLVFAFDCLYLNGEALLHRPLTERRAALYGALREVPGQLEFATAKTSRDVEELASFLNEAVGAATEGLIVKTLADAYDPARRSSHWLKLKKDYLAGVGDSFDCVPIGAFYGRGKRTGVFGAYLLAIFDDEGETFQTIAKVGTGFSEEQLKALAETLRPAIIPTPKPYYRFSDTHAPDVWFEPAVVWEVKAADLTLSPAHQAALGLVDSGKGISIRFPRLVRVRDDKKPEEATTAAQVADMFRNQAVVAARGGGKRAAAADADDDDDDA